MKRCYLSGISFLVVLSFVSCRSTPEEISEPPEPAQITSGETADSKVSFEHDIKPLLGENCVNCHNRSLMPERVSFESKALAMAATDGAPVIVPGHPDNSRMMAAVKQPDTAERAMPPVGHRISPDQIDLLRRWIAEGADWPAGREGEIQPMEIPRE